MKGMSEGQTWLQSPQAALLGVAQIGRMDRGPSRFSNHTCLCFWNYQNHPCVNKMLVPAEPVPDMGNICQMKLKFILQTRHQNWKWLEISTHLLSILAASWASAGFSRMS